MASLTQPCSKFWMFMGSSTAKKLLKNSLETSLLTFEELTTVLTQVKAVMNSRPLLPLETLPEDGVQPLTPTHFLMGKQQHLFQWRFLYLKQVVCDCGINFRNLLKATGKGCLRSISDILPEFPNGSTLLGTFVWMILLSARTCQLSNQEDSH